MFEGRLIAIHVAPKKSGPLQLVEQVEAVAGRGLRGDRYFRPEQGGRPEQEVTLIESEALDGLTRECKLTLAGPDARRNLLTQGVPLNHLVGREFQVGEVVLYGELLCEPCGHLEAMTVAGVREGLIHRGGLRARIVRGGLLRAGDPIRLREPQA